MKSTFAKLFKAFTYVALILLISCEEELPLEQSTENFLIENNGLKVDQYLFQELIKNKKFNKTYSEFENKKEEFKNKSLTNKSSNSFSENLYDFQIIKDKINVIVKDNITSYTMGVWRNVDSSLFFENLVLVPKEDETIDAFLYKYTKDSESDLSFGNQGFNFKGSLSVIKLDYNSINFSGKYEEECTDNFVLVCYGYVGDVCGTKPHFPETICYQSFSQCITFTFAGRSCSGTVGGGTNDLLIDSSIPHSTISGGTKEDVDIPTSPIISCGDEELECGKVINNIALTLNLSDDERNWLENQDNSYIIEVSDALDVGSLEIENFYKGQIQLETVTETVYWQLESGKISNRDDLAYNYIYSNGSQTFYKLTDGSVVIRRQTPFALNKNIQESFTSEVTNTNYYYIKPAGLNDWSSLMVRENNVNLADDLTRLFELGTQELAFTLGTYVVPVDDIKIILTGTDLNGDAKSRYEAGGYLLLSAIPGAKAVKAVGKVADATKVVVKLGSNTMVVDKLAAGLDIITLSNGVQLIKKTNSAIVARIANGIMTYKYAGYGADIVTSANKTTTVIGKWAGQIENIWNSGLAKQGANKGGLNVLGNVKGTTIAERWADNKKWLNEAISRGDNIRVSADPTLASNIINDNINQVSFNNFSEVVNYMKSFSENSTQFSNLGYFGKEVFTLIKNGYTFNSTTKQFVK